MQHLTVGEHLDFAWKAAGAEFAVHDAEPVAHDRSAHDQIRIGRRMLASAPPGSKLTGALPFDLREPGALWVGVPTELQLPRAERPRADRPSIVELPDGADNEFVRFAQEALAALESGELTKVVASRRIRVQNESHFRPLEVFARLALDQAAAAFLCRSQRGTLVGASPETLVRTRGVEFSSLPLAGSRSRSIGDRAQAAEILLHSDKDLREHQLVVDQILAALRSAGISTTTVTDPAVLGTERMWHLATEITATLTGGDTRDSLDLVELLHPTPAVCGTPSEQAFNFIQRHESGSRGFYSGAVGWQDQNGDGQWRVTLRCGLIDGDTAHVATGAGLVAGSEIDDELSETKHKAMTMLDAL